MKLLPSDEKDLLNKFDFYCKKVLKHKNYKLLLMDQKRRNRECVFSDLEDEIINKFYTEDVYKVLNFCINTDGLQITLENEMLYKALMLLSEKRLEILLLSFFLDMTDKEISKKLLIPQSTVQHNRVSALKYIRKIMEAEDNDK